ncbi:type II toxin-antitoxin system HicB family antitoxin [Leptospira weilii]|uniref:Ribbon-helix-helix protein, CopG family n=1 Tax=Leptospira weilii str. 2006001855 TaxID=996804 RepID=M6FHN4_9LEPT|nr:toxin-antitoxin system HicB family antitoxin [Leptospira weilii]EMM70612.1 ribbon-helix-helix protein, CopG family [Leptospira weilii str. 2006001855]UPY78205.1 type II toxin-antitoxin system HicB family antitoxin [Leptospira weilii]
MKTKASVLTIRIPSELKHKIEKVAEEQGVSINQLALYAFTKEIQDLETSQYFEKYYKGKTKKEIFADFRNVLSEINSDGKIPVWDKL